MSNPTPPSSDAAAQSQANRPSIEQQLAQLSAQYAATPRTEYRSAIAELNQAIKRSPRPARAA